MSLEYPIPGQRKVYVQKPDIYAIARLEDLKPIIDKVNELDAITENSPKVYSAVISQSGASAPSIDRLLKDDLTTVFFKRGGTGTYSIESNAKFTVGKTEVLFGPQLFVDNGCVFGFRFISNSLIELYTYKTGEAALRDEIMRECTIKVTVYS